MEFQIQDIDSGALIGLGGEIDLHTSPELKKKLTEVAQKKPSRVILNFAQVRYIDSSGLATIIDLFQKLKIYGGKLGLAGMNVSVKSVFEVARLNQVFSIYESEQQAVDNLK